MSRNGSQGSHHVWFFALTHRVAFTWVPAVRLEFGSVRHFPFAAFRSSSRPATLHCCVFCDAQWRNTMPGDAADVDEIAAQSEPDLSFPPVTVQRWIAPPLPQFAMTTLAPETDCAWRHSPSSALATAPTASLVTAL